MQYFSELPFGETPVPLADTEIPENFAPTAFVNEVGTPDVFESFLYVAGPAPQTPANSNFYNGVSDGRLNVPEPTTIAVLATALLLLAALSRCDKTRRFKISRQLLSMLLPPARPDANIGTPW